MNKLLLISIFLLCAALGWSQNSYTQGAVEDYTIQLNSGEADGAVYGWSVVPASGTSTILDSLQENTAQLVWDGAPGVYILQVQVNDGNGCLSEPITQQIEIRAAGNLEFAPTYPSTLTCSDFQNGTEGSDPAHAQSWFAVAYDGDAGLQSAQITIENPDGEFINLAGDVLPDQNDPGITVNNDSADNEIEFAVTDQWENNSAAVVNFTIKLLSVTTSDDVILPAVDGTDTNRTIGILQKPLIQFN